MTVVGSVRRVKQEADGDVHVGLALEPPWYSMLNEMNVEKQRGELILELVPADLAGCTPGQPARPPRGSYDYGICTGAALTVPRVGQFISATGPWVLDLEHGWTEIHPVWSWGPVR